VRRTSTFASTKSVQYVECIGIGDIIKKLWSYSQIPMEVYG